MAPPSTPQKTEAPARQEVLYDLNQLQPWREFSVILFNDEVHSQEEVVLQIIRALHCSVLQAHALMRKAEEAGKATVAIAHRERAVQITQILRQIDLRVTMRQIN